MVFSSSTFLFAFMPLFFAAYSLLPWRKAKNVWLLIASLFFYARGEPVYVLLMIASIAISWPFGLLVGKSAEATPGIAVIAPSRARNPQDQCSPGRTNRPLRAPSLL